MNRAERLKRNGTADVLLACDPAHITYGSRYTCLELDHGCTLADLPTANTQIHYPNTHTENSPVNGQTSLARARGCDDPGTSVAINESSSEIGGTPHDPPAPNQRTGRRQDGRSKKRRKKTKGRLRLGTLNMRGYTSSGGGPPTDKWLCINQVIRDNRIAVLALQETHLTAERINLLNTLFKSSLLVIASANPANESGAGGVAIALNRRLVDIDKAQKEEIVPGRAMEITIPWTGGRNLKVLNVYAPNVSAESVTFWKKLEAHYDARPRNRPDFMLGDFNLVESSIDRLPPRMDATGPTESLKQLIRSLNLTDGWRETEPTRKQYTFLQSATGSQSRIDRIYVKRTLHDNAEDWDFQGPGFHTDHKLVTCSIANYGAAHIGPGRWALPHTLLTDAPFQATMKTLGEELQLKLERMRERTNDDNPQTLYNTFKTKLLEKARQRAKVSIPKLDRRITALKKAIDDTLNNPQNARTDPMREAGILQERLTKLEIRRFGQKRNAVAANHWAHGETICRYWTRLNAAPPPTTVINELLTDEQGSDHCPRYTNNTEEMAEIAKRHYDRLQTDDTLDGSERQIATVTALETCNVSLTTREKGALARKLTRLEVETALTTAAANKAPGLDGIPAELWKLYHTWNKQGRRRESSTVDIVAILTAVFNDIEEYGVASDTDFNAGWICPIYKKKDQRRIVNYRPITLLNADYKIMTRVLANRMAAVADSLIHRDQTGFVPGRQIFEHIRLAQNIIDYAEAEEVNGVIVALDQEKAYDRVNHEYLWQVLDAMNFPRHFIQTVKALYSNAVSMVVVNGVKSSTFRITRGVRQGDPMSCLLFDLAIEPLACMLRASPLRGIAIPGATDRILTKLFADDTTVYLHEEDDYRILSSVLQAWCTASRAKFNEDKTEHIPFGSVAFRHALVNGTNQSMLGTTLPRSSRISGEGEAVRILGAWIGNHVDPEAPWNQILETIERNLERWGHRRPTMYGRKLIIGMEVGGRTQFLAKAQGMPENVERKLIDTIFHFIWNGEKKPRIGRDTVHLPLKDGGINLLDIAARNEAIELTWLKDYLALDSDRPPWALVADLTMARAVKAASRSVNGDARINCFLQTWDVSLRQSAGLSATLRRMMKIALKHNVCADSPNPTEELKMKLPIWYHIGREEGRNPANTVASKCLREKHEVVSVLDCSKVAARLTNQVRNHRQRIDCPCGDCTKDRDELGCNNPHRCALAAQKAITKLVPLWKPGNAPPNDGLTLTKHRKQANMLARAGNGRVLFNPLSSDPASISEMFRIFANPKTDPARTHPAHRPPRTFAVQGEEVVVYTDGSCMRNGQATAHAGSGVWFGPTDARNIASGVPGPHQSNQTAELYAVALAADVVPPFTTMHVITDSRYVLDGMVEHLPQWEARGWLGIANAEMIREVAARLRARSAPTTFQWTKGHTGVEGNEGADRLAKKGADEGTETHVLPPAPQKFLRKGVKLSALTQKLAYQAIRASKKRPHRQSSENMVARIQATLAEDLKYTPTEGHLWTAIRHKDVSRKMRDFLWKATHDALRVGQYWEHIPGYETRAVCEPCGVTESLEHILLECDATGPQAIWELTKRLLNQRGVELPPLSLGMLLGAPAFTLRELRERRTPGLDRLCRIVLTESTHLVWKLRCERVIQRENDPERWHTKAEVANRWRKAILTRYGLDRMLSRRKLGTKGTSPSLLEATWGDPTADAREDRSLLSGVLVGSTDEIGVG